MGGMHICWCVKWVACTSVGVSLGGAAAVPSTNSGHLNACVRVFLRHLLAHLPSYFSQHRSWVGGWIHVCVCVDTGAPYIQTPLRAPCMGLPQCGDAYGAASVWGCMHGDAWGCLSVGMHAWGCMGLPQCGDTYGAALVWGCMGLPQCGDACVCCGVEGHWRCTARGTQGSTQVHICIHTPKHHGEALLALGRHLGTTCIHTPKHHGEALKLAPEEVS